MSTRIPVYAHIFGEGLSVFKTNGRRVIPEPGVPAVSGLVGHIIAPDRTLIWKGDNGIDIYRTVESFEAAAKATNGRGMDGPPYYRRYEGARILPESLDLVVAVFYAERDMHDLSWEPAIETSCSRSAPVPAHAAHSAGSGGLC